MILGRIFAGLTAVLLSLPMSASATTWTMTAPDGTVLPTAYPQAGGVAFILTGVNGNIYYQFSNPTGAFVGFQSTGNPAAFRGNPFTINNPLTLDCGNSACSTYFGGAIAQMQVRFSAYDGDTQIGGFDEDDISLIMNGYNVGSWSGITTEITNNSGTTSGGFVDGFGNNTFNTAWFTSTNPALLANILSTGQTTTQVLDADPNDNYWNFTRGGTLASPSLATIAPGYDMVKTADTGTYSAVGDTITYTYIVTNIGSVQIDNLAVSDDKIASVSCDKTTILDTAFATTADFATCTGIYTITQADIDAGSVTNIASATGTPEFGSLGTLSDTVTVTGPAEAPVLSLVKAAGVATFSNAGTTVPYNFTLRNDGNVTLNNVTVTDPLIPSLSCSYATLAPGAQRVCSANYTVTQADVDAWINFGTQLTNTATMAAQTPSGTNVSTMANENLDGPSAAPSLTVAKTAAPSTFGTVGSAINYTIRVTNTGNVTFPNAPAVSDPLITNAGGSVSCPAGTVAPGAFIDCTASYTITQADIDAGSVANTASASITVAGVPANGSDNATSTATQSPSLTIVKMLDPSSPASFNATGVSLTYDYILTNNGNVTLNTPSVSDNLVAVTCPTGTIAPGTSVTCNSAAYVTTQADLDAGGVTNLASASALDVNSNPVASTGNDSVTVPATQSPAMSLVKSVPTVPSASFAPGLMVTYTYDITNTGNVSITNQIQVTDDQIGAAFNCGTPPLAVGASLQCTAIYTVTAADVAAGLVINTASASDGTTTSNTDTATIPQAGAPGITLAKSATTANFSTLADTLNYSFTVTNSGQTVIVLPGQPITINDPKATGISCSQPATFSPGDSYNCTGSYASITQAEMDAGQVVNTATASYTHGGSTTITSPSSTATVPANVTPSLTLAKSASSAQFSSVGQNITYTFTVTNTGVQTLATTTVTDPLIPGLSCTLTNIAPNGGTQSCTAIYAITQADFDAGTLTNNASALGTTPDGGSATGTASETITIQPGAGTKSMTLGKSASSGTFAGVGSTIDYTFTVNNTGTQTLTGINITDPLIPAFSCNIAAIAPMASDNSCVASYTVTQADVDAGSVMNTATATAPGATTVTGNETVNGPTRTPGLSVVKSGPASFTTTGEVLTFNFTISNTGNVTLSAITVTDPLIPTLGCTIATLAPGATDTSCTGTITTTQAHVDAGQVMNVASYTTTAPNGATPSGTASATVPGPAEAPALTVVKSENDGSGGFGAITTSETYDFVVTNTGNVTLTGLNFSDPLTGFSCALADLAPSASTTTCASSAPLQSSVTITQAMFDAGSLSNTATVTGQTTTGTPISQSDTLVLAGPTRTLAIAVNKSATAPLPAFDAPGQVINYDYVVTNSGNTTITAPVTIVDDTIATVNCPATPAAGIAPGGTLTCTASYAVTQADIDAGGVTNIADATVSQTLQGDPSPTVAMATDSETVSSTQLPAMTVDKGIQAGTPAGYSAVGDVLTYDFLVTNTGNTTIVGPISIDDNLITPTFSCLAGSLAPGANTTCSATYTVTQPDLDAGSVTNTASAYTGPIGAPTLQSPTDSVTAFATQTPDLTVAKSTTQGAASEFFLGNTIAFTYDITNSGNVTIPGPITISDNLVSSVSCPTASLAPMAMMTCTGSYVITSNDLALGTAANNASAVATFGGNPVPSNTDSVVIPAGSAPALTISKTELTGAPLSMAGQTLTYQYTVTNTGNGAFASDVNIFDDKISGAILCHDSMAGTVPFNTQASAVAPFTATCTAPYTVTQADMDAGFVTNTAYAQSVFAPASPSPTTVQSPADAVTVNAAATPALTTIKAVTAGPNPALLGQSLTYTITTTNTGNQTISAITVTDPLIPSLSCTIGGSPAPANITLAPMQVLICTGTYMVTQADIDAQSLTNTATIDGVSPNGTPVTGTAGTSHPVDPAMPSVSLVKTILSPLTSPVFNGPGEPITYGVTVMNNGNVTLNSTTVTDPLDPSTTCTVGVLAPGASDNSCVFNYAAQQIDVDQGSITNTATAVSQPANPGAGTVSGSGSVTASGPPASVAFALSKAANVTGFTLAGQVITYTYVVTNVSNVTVRGTPSVVDDKIGTFTCGSGPLAPGDQTSCTANYTVLQTDLNFGSITNNAQASAPAVPAGGGFPASPAVPLSPVATVVVPAIALPSISVTKSVVSEVKLFPTVWQVTFALDVVNDGNLTLTNLDIQDDLTAFVTPGTLLSATYPVVTRVTGFTTATANPTYDGVADTQLLMTGDQMDPLEVGRIEIDVTYSTASGYPTGTNTAVADSPILTAPVTATASTSGVDSDGDGVVDSAESCTTDRDGDGICDAQDYDPTGYFYCEDTGLILSGGSISVTGPAGTQTGIGTSNNITILRDGSTGEYQFFVSAPGVYTLTPTYPTAGIPSTTRVPVSTPVDVTSLGADPAVLGSTEFGTSATLADSSAAANTPSYLVFDIQAGDPNILANNLALTNCASVQLVTATKTVSASSARRGDTVQHTLTFTNGTSFAGTNVTLVDQLPSGMVYTPGSAMLNGTQIEPTIVGNRLEWTGQNLTPGNTTTLVISVRITGGGGAGELTNRAWLEGPGVGIASNIAEASLRIEPEHVFDCSDIIGKVYDDKNHNGYPDEGEPGLAGARVVTLQGVKITTDEFGRFHVPCAELPAQGGSNLALKLDPASLPTGYRVTTENPRMIRVTAGKLAKINFGASISRIVDVHLSTAAFNVDTAEEIDGIQEALEGVVAQIIGQPSVLRLSYINQGDPQKLIRQRVNRIESLIRELWDDKGRYKLVIERTIKEVQ